MTENQNDMLDVEEIEIRSEVEYVAFFKKAIKDGMKMSAFSIPSPEMIDFSPSTIERFPVSIVLVKGGGYGAGSIEIINYIQRGGVQICIDTHDMSTISEFLF